MTRWEYCEILWVTRSIADEEKERIATEHKHAVFKAIDDGLLAIYGYVFFLGPPQKEEPITDRSQTIAQLGRDGWELVSHVDRGSAEILFFKRTIEG